MVQRLMILIAVFGRRIAVRWGSACITAVLSLLIGVARLPAQENSAAPQHPPQMNADLLDELDQQFADLVENAHRSVVSIRGQLRRAQVGGARPGQIPVQVTGSGFLLPGGIVVTTAEVVANITNPSVIFPDGPSIRATAIGWDTRTNIAILRIKPRPGQVGLHVGDSKKVRAGNLAITIGNYSGFDDSATLGIISNAHQKAMSSKDGKHYESLIQFQGAVGGGSIGSPLLNRRGEVIGMVIGMMMGPGVDSNSARFKIIGSSNMGFALPSAVIRDMLDGIVQNAKPLPEAGWFGFNLPKGSDSTEVIEIYVDSPADHAGMQIGDIVIAVDDEPIRTNSELRRMAEQLSAGQKVRIDLRRGEKTLQLQLEITPKPDPKDWIKKPGPPGRVGISTDDVIFYHPMS
jgi:S1-C subfamily serine protease